MFHIHQDSAHYAFDSFGETPTEAARTFLDGWYRWCDQSGAALDYWQQTEAELAGMAYEVLPGRFYIDQGELREQMGEAHKRAAKR